ncbi:1,2-phenylacetyl-CoA epoxidase, subunit C [compost metagenome]
MAARGIGCELAALRAPWLAHVREVLEEGTLTVPDETAANHLAYRGGRQGRHTEELGYVLAEMQYLPRAYPGATW